METTDRKKLIASLAPYLRGGAFAVTESIAGGGAVTEILTGKEITGRFVPPESSPLEIAVRFLRFLFDDDDADDEENTEIKVPDVKQYGKGGKAE